MSALQDLERTLARAVDAGAAADPARAADRGTVPASPHGGRRRRWFGPGRLLVGVLIAGGVTTGALAASGVLRLANEPELGGMRFVAHEGVGVRKGPVRILPLRVKDPAGGPPWAIRTFETTRHAACAQAGQLYRGRFGRVEDDGTGAPVFRIASDGPGFHIVCGAQVVGGAPAFPGMSSEVRTGGNASSARCAPRPGRRDPCPVSAVTRITFGILGPQARSVEVVRRDGSRSGPQRVSELGAYLLVSAADPRPARQIERSLAEAQADVDRRFPRPDYRSLNAAERKVADRRWRERTQYASERYRQNREARRRIGMAAARPEPVFATFSGGVRQQVVGGDATAKALPGVQLSVDELPQDAAARAQLRVRYRGAGRAVAVSFRAPVALDRMQRSFIVTVHGPRAPTCQDPDLGYEYVGESLDAGDVVRVRVKSAQGEHGPVGWCQGASYEARLRLRTMTGLRGGRRDQLVARRSFTAR